MHRGGSSLEAPIITECTQEIRLNSASGGVDVFNVYIKFAGTARTECLQAEFYDNQLFGTKDKPYIILSRTLDVEANGWAFGSMGSDKILGVRFAWAKSRDNLVSDYSGWIVPAYKYL